MGFFMFALHCTCCFVVAQGFFIQKEEKVIICHHPHVIPNQNDFKMRYLQAVHFKSNQSWMLSS